MADGWTAKLDSAFNIVDNVPRIIKALFPVFASLGWLLLASYTRKTLIPFPKFDAPLLAFLAIYALGFTIIFIWLMTPFLIPGLLQFQDKAFSEEFHKRSHFEASARLSRIEIAKLHLNDARTITIKYLWFFMPFLAACLALNLADVISIWVKPFRTQAAFPWIFSGIMVLFIVAFLSSYSS